MTENFQYSGHDNLDLMSLAENYNQSIFYWLQKSASFDDPILDFGAGHGEFFFRFEKAGYKVIAVELDKSAHDRYPPKKIFSSLTEVPRTFRMIYSVNVLEHIENDAAAVMQLRGKLSSTHGGVKILVPARQELFSVMDEKFGHFRRYERRQLIDLFEENGFAVTSCRYFDFIGYFAMIFYKYTDNSGKINRSALLAYDRYIFPLSRMLDKLFGWFIGKNLILEAHVK